MADNDESIVAITAAMPSGTGLNNFAKSYPYRYYDVGIAEQHAATFAAGMAKENMKPYFAVYSSFLQRGYDQVIHDVSITNKNVTFIQYKYKISFLFTILEKAINKYKIKLI